MGKVKSKKKVNPLYKRVDEVPENKIAFVDAILQTIIEKIKEEEEVSKKKKYDFSDLAGTLKLPKNFDAVKWQRKLRDEWD
ncbi:MAG: hypothetical protein KF900_02495 [Bacteroidetes bacterium]|nr:hypothetical protein [Bacteroidota bacterium]